MSLTRTCGSCTACCKSLEVVELEKPIGKWCSHCNVGKGCKIYQNRPQSCQDFRCEWLKGFGAEHERPDLSKVIFDYVVDPNGLPEGQFQIWEVREGALDQPLVRERTLFSLSRGIWVIHIPLHGQRTFFFPPGKVLSAPFVQHLYKLGMKIKRAVEV